MFRAETVRIEGARAFERFQEQVAFALLRVEDALADALCGVGSGEGGGGVGSGGGGGGDGGGDTGASTTAGDTAEPQLREGGEGVGR